MSISSVKAGMHVLITGGSGIIGRYLTSILLENGYKVSHLSRKQDQFGKVRVHRWDPEKRILDPVVLSGVDCIVHLAGANIGEKRWTAERKKEILASRVNTAHLLFKVADENKIPIKTFISASATGYYGALSSDRIFTEEDPSASDFLGSTCNMWEVAADMFINRGIRVVKIRTGVVLEKNSGVLKTMLKPIKYGIFPVLGTGRQYLPWIHITDLCNIYLSALNNDNMKGAYNAVAPQHITYHEFIRTLASAMDKKGIYLPVPSFLLKTTLGEMADILLKGSRISSRKIIETGCQFIFDNLDKALTDLVNRQS
jgi:uncharacterized protein (TIGR01777 family)